MVSYYGNNCHLCAAMSGDVAVRQKLVDAWRKIHHHEMYTAENVKCDGCRSNGKLADPLCKIRSCVTDKELASCAECDEFPCDKIGSFIQHRCEMMLWGHNKMPPLSEEEFKLAILPFDSLENLTRALIDAGKLPEWLRKY